ncbi:MAG: DALR anticodon-binding domain-containing protein, partial [Nostocaceae cyanobacterium]|nr:DALR anticodon-binding domain-containing protein [Nostocaceae cyanobacterium]
HVTVNPTMLAAWLQTVASGGLLNGELNDLGDKEDLETMEELPMPNPPCPMPHAPFPMPHAQSPMPHAPFPIQYAHARCCSLLRLAHREGLITLEPEPDNNLFPERIIAPNPLPWLDSDGQLCLVHPAENRLIDKLVQVIDDLYCGSPQQRVNWEKTALDLSAAFGNFWADCRIWGELKGNCKNLAQARLGLIMVTQSVFRLLLQDCLGVEAALEL